MFATFCELIALICCHSSCGWSCCRCTFHSGCSSAYGCLFTALFLDPLVGVLLTELLQFRANFHD